jgi:uncharacterized protein YegP (UPF0339 family)
LSRIDASLGLRLSATLASFGIWKGTAMAYKFEIYKDKAGEYRVRFKYNAEIMFSTEGYSSKASAQNAIDSLKKNAPGAEVDDQS